MDFDLRDWLVILGAVFVLAVLIHGWVRRNSTELKMELDKSFMGKGDVDELSMLKAELPNGGARVIIKPEQQSLDLEEDVPMLMEPVSVPDEPVVVPEPVAEEIVPDATVVEETPVAEAPIEPETPVAKAPPARKPDVPKPEKFVVINILAADQFAGQALLEALVSHGLSFGEMEIFHSLDENDVAEFSLVNAVEPGTFNPAAMNETQTPGVSLFMRAHELDDPVAVFERMIDVAAGIADELGGQLCDDSRSAMTEQTIDAIRQGLKEFQFRHSA